MTKHIAIFGVSISGLTALYYLQNHAYSVTVYEALHPVDDRMRVDQEIIRDSYPLI